MRAFHGIPGGRRPDHQARRAQHALAMSLLDGFVDLLRNPEIVGVENQPLQCVFALSIPAASSSTNHISRPDAGWTSCAGYLTGSTGPS